MKAIALFPGTMGLAGLAIRVFGRDNVVVGEWRGPVYLLAEPEEERPAADVQAAVELIQEEALRSGVTVTAVETVL
jgi:hypothetical protein